MLNIAANLERSAAVAPGKIAIHFSDKTFTYGQLDALANQVANGLRAMGILPGDKVALSCPNLPYFPMIYFGTLKAGAVVVPLNVLLKPAEIAYHLEDSQAKAYFCFDGTSELPIGEMGWAAFNQVPGCEHFVMITADPTEPAMMDGVTTFGMLIKNQATAAELALRNPDDTAVILYTSGTTGKPKGAELTHANIAMNTASSQIILRFTADDTQLITLPLFHSFGQVVQMNAAVQSGGTMVLVPRFDAGLVLTTMLERKVSVFVGVPTMYIGLLQAVAGRSDRDISAIASQLRLAVSGGAALPVEVIRQFEERFKVPILEGYGLSETSPVATFNHLEFERRPGSVGYPIAGVGVRIVDPNGNPLPAGREGEVAIRGHNVMKGYFNRPQETANAIRNGWFLSGDVGRLDGQGYLYIVDRLKDMIIRGGFNVYPREIEETMMMHPSVAMVAVIGAPHPKLGEEVNALVVAKPGAVRDPDALRAWCKERMADYKYPRMIEYVDKLPMTATGKILKRELRAVSAN